MNVRRGDIVRAEDEEGANTAVVVQSDMLTRLTVVVCMITEVSIDVTLPIRVPLRARVYGVKLPAQVFVDKPFTIARAPKSRECSGAWITTSCTSSKAA